MEISANPSFIGPVCGVYRRLASPAEVLEGLGKVVYGRKVEKAKRYDGQLENGNLRVTMLNRPND